MSIDSISLILECAYHCKISEQPYGRLLQFKLHKEDDWQQMEIQAWVWARIEKRYKRFIDKWVVEDENE